MHRIAEASDVLELGEHLDGAPAEHLSRDGDDEGVEWRRRLPGRHGTCDGSGRLQVGGGEQARRPHRFHLPGEL